MSKKSISIGEASDRYRARVNARQRLESEVGDMSMRLREKESELRDARDQERRALAQYEQAVEDAE